jgi:hypothetical protein
MTLRDCFASENLGKCHKSHSQDSLQIHVYTSLRKGGGQSFSE